MANQYFKSVVSEGSFETTSRDHNEAIAAILREYESATIVHLVEAVSRDHTGVIVRVTSIVIETESQP